MNKLIACVFALLTVACSDGTDDRCVDGVYDGTAVLSRDGFVFQEYPSLLSPGSEEVVPYSASPFRSCRVLGGILMQSADAVGLVLAVALVVGTLNIAGFAPYCWIAGVGGVAMAFIAAASQSYALYDIVTRKISPCCCPPGGSTTSATACPMCASGNTSWPGHPEVEREQGTDTEHVAIAAAAVVVRRHGHRPGHRHHARGRAERGAFERAPRRSARR